MVISKESDQMIYHEDDCPYVKRMRRKNIKHVSESKAISDGYHYCSYCGGLHGAYLRFQSNPNLYGKSHVGLTASYDQIDKALCFRTSNGFWKILKNPEAKDYRLWHLNHGDFNPILSDKELMRRSFHRQVDVKATFNIPRIVYYISEHDKAKKIMDVDWKKLPNKTPKQKKYYKQAAKRERIKQNRRIDELFEKLEKGEL